MLRHLISLVAGAVGVLAFAPYGLWLATIPSLATLFLLLYYSTSARDSFTLGYSFGVGLFGFGIYWIYFSLHLFGAAIAPLAVVGTLLFIAMVALYLGLFGWLTHKLQKERSTLWFVFGVPALWLIVEWFRSWFLTGFPWLSLGYSTIHSPLAGYAPVGGVYLNSLLLAVISGAAATVVAKRTVSSGVIMLTLVLLIGLSGMSLSKIRWSEAFAQPVSVTMVQGNIAQDMKFLPDLLDESIRIYAEHSKTGADLIIWPESAIPTFYTDVADWEAEFVRELSEQGSTVLAGGFHANADYSEYYNAIKVLGGTESQIYTKRHLVPFGEFIPFRGLVSFLSDLIEIPMSDLSAGKGEIAPLEINGVHYGMSICYEDAFGNEMLVQFPKTNVLVNISNDAWFGDSTAPHQHQEVAAMRALESSRPMIRVTNTGISSLISIEGKVVERGEQFVTSAISIDVQPRTGLTLFVEVGNWLVVTLSAIFLLIQIILSKAATSTGARQRG